jgi:DNA-binding MarR family transcriptional regulator
VKHPSDTRETDGHLPVLRALAGAGHVSQRSIAESVGIAPSRVNRVIRGLVSAGRVEVVDHAVRPYAYRLTVEGRSYLQRLAHEHDAVVVARYRSVQHRIGVTLENLRLRGIERLVFYGAGEVMEVAHSAAVTLGFEVVGIVDDDPAKHGAAKGGLAVLPPASVSRLDPEALVITTFRHADEIRTRLGTSIPAGLVVVTL